MLNYCRVTALHAFLSYRSLLFKYGTLCVFELPLGDLETTYDIHLGLIGKRTVDFLIVLIELFSPGVMAADNSKMFLCKELLQNDISSVSSTEIRSAKQKSCHCCNVFAQSKRSPFFPTSKPNCSLPSYAYKDGKKIYGFCGQVTPTTFKPECWSLTCLSE